MRRFLHAWWHILFYKTELKRKLSFVHEKQLENFVVVLDLVAKSHVHALLQTPPYQQFQLMVIWFVSAEKIEPKIYANQDEIFICCFLYISFSFQ
jgi:hypothetical protein